MSLSSSFLSLRRVTQMGKRYTREQVAACAIVTAGVMIVTLAENSAQTSARATNAVETTVGDGLDNEIVACAVSCEDGGGGGGGGDVASLDFSLDTHCCASAKPSQSASEFARSLMHAWWSSFVSMLQSNSASDSQVSTWQQLNWTEVATWYVGLGLMTSALCIASVLGHLQERLYRRWGDVREEYLFYSHALALPMFVATRSDIAQHARLWLSMTTTTTTTTTETVVPSLFTWFTAPVASLFASVSPSTMMFCVLAANISLQWVCIRGVQAVAAHHTTLTTTMVVTVRKFSSLLISVLYFGSAFTPTHQLGSACVCAGVFYYAYVSRSNAAKAAAASSASPSKTRSTKTKSTSIAAEMSVLRSIRAQAQASSTLSLTSPSAATLRRRKTSKKKKTSSKKKRTTSSKKEKTSPVSTASPPRRSQRIRD
jgi:UDP-xylose/UDP-N-acetylglucosamine transporter B4